MRSLEIAWQDLLLPTNLLTQGHTLNQQIHQTVTLEIHSDTIYNSQTRRLIIFNHAHRGKQKGFFIVFFVFWESEELFFECLWLNASENNLSSLIMEKTYFQIKWTILYIVNEVFGSFWVTLLIKSILGIKK